MKDEAQSQRSWWELKIEADPQTHEAISAYLFDLGCTGVLTHDHDPGQLQAYLQADPKLVEQIEAIRKHLEKIPSLFPGARMPTLHVKHVESQNWSENWKRFFTPEAITDGLLIIPTWETPPSISSGKVILMDPGPAFGTGKHPTTKMCLRALERIEKRRSWDMLDVGTGSGILAIYGAMLGACRIVAIDIDLEALRWAKRNAELNKVENTIHFANIPLEKIKTRFSVVVANLIYDTICALDKHLIRVTSPNGDLVLSGLLKDQVDAVVQRFCCEGLEIREVDFMEEWATVLLVKTNSV